MSVGIAQELYRKWYENEENSCFRDAIDSALIKIGLTDKYIGQISRPRESTRLDIKDKVWGMVKVEGSSLNLLDSPILQRLRRIKQLGFSYLVYPTADHSRFEHSLGVYHVARCYIDEINEQQRSKSKTRLANGLSFAKISKTDRIDLLHSALLHDVGHLPFSHVVERIFQSARAEFQVGGVSVQEFLRPLFKIKNLPLSEALSIAIVLSPRFQRFYKKLRPQEHDAPYRIALLIAGERIRENDAALPELISSSLDADKIDYQLRDSAACNIPVGVDVSRLFHRAAFITAEPHAVPEGVGTRRIADQPYTIFTVNASGIDTVEEVAIARTLLYQRVYSHRVTRSAERVLGQAFFEILDNAPSPFTDAIEVWKLGDEALLTAIQNTDRCSIASGLAGNLINRQLPKRACAFGPGLVATLVPIRSVLKSASEENEKSTRKAIRGEYIEKLKEDSLCGRNLGDLENKVLEEAVRIRNILKDSKIPNLPKSEPNSITILPLPELGHKRYDGMVLEAHGEVSSASSYTRIQQLMDAEEITKMVGYVHTEEVWRPIVALAFRNIIYDYFSSKEEEELREGKIIFDDPDAPSVSCSYLMRFRLDTENIIRRARLRPEIVEKFQNCLAEHGEYDKIPQMAPRYMGARADSIANRFKTFNGQRGWQVSGPSVRAFLEQFPPRLREELAELLENENGVRFLDRTKVVGLLHTAIKEISSQVDGNRRFIAPLTPNSGNLVRQIIEQDLRASLAEIGWEIKHSISEVLGIAKKGDGLVLCDDNVSSGSQASAQFLSWYGRDRTEWPYELRTEAGIDDVALRENDKETLNGLNVGIAVCIKGENAAKNVSAQLEGLGINFQGICGGESLTNSAEQFEKLSPELKQELEFVGKNVLSYAHTRMGLAQIGQEEFDEKCQSNALGYGGLKGLMVTMLNVPTSTIPALWCPGLVRGEPWMPLFIRRGYLDHLVIA